MKRKGKKRKVKPNSLARPNLKSYFYNDDRNHASTHPSVVDNNNNNNNYLS